MIEKNNFSNIKQNLDEFVAEIRENLNYNLGIGHVPGSKASYELNSFQNAMAVKTAHNQGYTLLQVALDHFSSFTRTLESPTLTISPWANARSVIEASAISTWLLDTAINTNERVSRSYAFRVDGLEEQVKYARSTGDIQVEEQSQKRLDNVIEKAKQLGLTKTDEKGNTRLSLVMLDVTSLVRTQLNEEPAYRLFSAMLHAHIWAMIQLGFTPIKELSDGRLFQQNISPVSVGYIAIISINSIQKSIFQKYELFNWPFDDVKTSFTKIRQFLKDNIPIP